MGGAPFCELRCDRGAMEAADREERCGPMIVVFAARALRPERAHDVGAQFADVLDHVGGHAIDRGRREPAVRPLEEARLREPDQLRGGLPFARAFRGEVLRRPRAKLFSEPAALVTARQREQRGDVSLRRELHRRAGDAERLVSGWA